MASTEYVQPIVVTRSGTHQDVIAAAALASLGAYQLFPEVPSWNQWMSGRFTKTVRRARPAQFVAATELSLVEVTVGYARACAFAPMFPDDFPHAVSKLQVSGTNMEHAQPDTAQPGQVVVYLNQDLHMSTGKSAAQASHALWMWFLTANPTDRILWSGQLCVAQLSEPQFSTQGAAAHVVVDAGLTETSPGCTTAFAKLCN